MSETFEERLEQIDADAGMALDYARRGLITKTEAIRRIKEARLRVARIDPAFDEAIAHIESVGVDGPLSPLAQSFAKVQTEADKLRAVFREAEDS